MWPLGAEEGERLALTVATVRRLRLHRDRLAPASAAARPRGQADRGASNTSTRTVTVGDDDFNHPDGPSLVLCIRRAV